MDELINQGLIYMPKEIDIQVNLYLHLTILKFNITIPSKISFTRLVDLVKDQIFASYKIPKEVLLTFTLKNERMLNQNDESNLTDLGFKNGSTLILKVYQKIIIQIRFGDDKVYAINEIFQEIKVDRQLSFREFVNSIKELINLEFRNFLNYNYLTFTTQNNQQISKNDNQSLKELGFINNSILLIKLEKKIKIYIQKQHQQQYSNNLEYYCDPNDSFQDFRNSICQDNGQQQIFYQFFLNKQRIYQEQIAQNTLEEIGFIENCILLIVY